MEKEIMLFEDFAKMYKIWKNKESFRKEDGFFVKTPYGNHKFKNPNCDYEKVIKKLLDENNFCMELYKIQATSYSDEERKNILDGNVDLNYPLEKYNHGCMCCKYSPYDEISEDLDFDTEDVCEYDYKVICKLLSNYILENDIICNYFYLYNNFTQTNQFILYEGSVPDDFDYEELSDYFNEKYETNLKKKRIDDNTILIGAFMGYDNFKRYKEMKKDAESFFKEVD